MKQALDLIGLATKVQSQISLKADFIQDTRNIEVSSRDNLISLDTGDFQVTDHTHSQIAARTGIPQKYYKRMRENAPDLLDSNIRNWFDEEPERRMVRTMGDNARAFLSDSYKRIDNEQILSHVLPILVDSNSGIEVKSCDVTETKMYLQCVFPRMEQEIKFNDAVQYGFTVRNGEIGNGYLEIDPLVYRLVCSNGMIAPQKINGGVRAMHRGRKITDTGVVRYSDETREAEDRVIMLKIRDAITQLSDPEQFFKLVQQMQQAAEGKTTENPVKAVEALGKAFLLPEKEQNSVLENFLREGDLTKWGMLNAVTSVANEHSSYDRAIELEEMGGKILNLNPNAWNQIAEAA